MEEEKVAVENHLTSAAAFVEGGIQDACDDACSICLEAFCESDPSTLTSCKHEFHLQCILEWCQRSSQCPMCWQSISLKDPNSQELLDAVEHERNVRMNPPRNRTIFHHPTLGDFELQHLPVNASESDLEERIIQHLAAAAAMGRARHFSRREGHHHSRSSAQGRPQFLVFSTNPNESLGNSSNAVSDGHPSPPQAVIAGTTNSPLVRSGEGSPQLITQPPNLRADQITTSLASNTRRAPSQTSPNNQDRAGPSDFHSFSENLKSRLTSLSTRYKDSITKSTKSWKEKLFNRSNSSSPEPRNDATNQNPNTVQSIPNVSRMMDHLNIAQDDRIQAINASPLRSGRSDDSEAPNPSERRANEEEDARVPCPAGSTTSS